MSKAIKGKEPHVIEDKACPWAIQKLKIKLCLECTAPLQPNGDCVKDMNSQRRIGYINGYDCGNNTMLKEVICGK